VGGFTSLLGGVVWHGGVDDRGRDRVRVGDVELHFARACIATGSRPRIPPIVGLADSGYLTNESLFDLTHLPRRFAVVGGGPIGCEMAQAFARFGSKVILVQSGERLLEHDDPDAAAVVQSALEADGVDVRCGRKLDSVKRRGDGKVLRLTSRLGPEEVVVDDLLLGVGRVPVVDGLGLDQAGVESDEKRGVLVDDHLCTSNSRIYAAGDVCLPEKFTHTADAAARIVIQNALFFGRKKHSRLCIPWCTYTEPELAHTGISAEEARERGHAVVTEEVRFADVDRAIVDGETAGFLRVHADAKSGRILGATLVGAHAGELISQITAAVVAGTSLTQLSAVIHPYPTLSEAVRKAADAHRRRGLTPFRQRLLRRFLAWRRGSS
jgi:pyruvate/2-oxoglutarate dehydrogenase complex dihydrolipoamide dehydrogenase (E3) component